MNKKAGVNYCKCCKSTDLFDNHIDKEGYYNPNGRYITICQTCGTIQQDYKKKKKMKGDLKKDDGDERNY